MDIQAIEEALDLADEGREGLKGLYRFNVVAVPRLRLVGINLLFFVAALHNILVFGELDLATFLPVLVGAELYRSGYLGGAEGLLYPDLVGAFGARFSHH